MPAAFTCDTFFCCYLFRLNSGQTTQSHSSVKFDKIFMHCRISAQKCMVHDDNNARQITKSHTIPRGLCMVNIM